MERKGTHGKQGICCRFETRVQRWWSRSFKNSHRPKPLQADMFENFTLFLFYKSRVLVLVVVFFFFYISVSVQTRYILVLFSQYRCKTKDDSYCCTRSQGRRDGGAEVWAALAFPPPRCWTQPCSPPRRLNRSIPPQRRLISFLTLRGAAPLSPRSSPCQG